MQASQKRRISNMSNKLHHYHHHHPLQEAESHFLPQFRAADPEPCHNGGRFSAAKRSLLPYCTLESSSAATRGGCYNAYGNSASTVSFSPNGGSPLPDSAYGSPISGSCVTDDVSDLRYKLKEIESAMLGPDHHLSASGGYESPFQSGTGTSSALCHGNESWGRIADSISRGDVKQVLISCAKAVADDDLMMAQWLMDELRRMVSVSGQPMQRLGAYMLEGLVARLASSGSSICKALKCKEPASSELLSYMHILYELCPYFKFGYMSANGAIAEAMKDENRVHIVDFQIAQGSQWITLIQAFAARPGGPPHIRITGIDDSTSAYARGGGLNIVGRKLSKLAETFKVPFEFHAAAVSGSEVTLESLAIRPGEAVAVNFAFALHHMADESVSTQNHRDRLLRLAKGLSPRVVTLVEQESNNNTAPFLPRFAEALDYYAAMFESIDATPARDHRERISVEQHCLARELVNIIACEGAERVERHELLGKWRSRLGMAGFRPYPLSSLVNGTIKTLLQSYSNKYRLEERDGALYLGWMDRFLVTSSAWQ